ncbi:hypothetical protein ACVWZZ_006357 [Bradyrhizobium sp. LM6.10]
MGRLSGPTRRIRCKPLTNYELSELATITATTSACSSRSIDNKSIQMRGGNAQPRAGALELAPRPGRAPPLSRSGSEDLVGPASGLAARRLILSPSGLESGETLFGQEMREPIDLPEVYEGGNVAVRTHQHPIPRRHGICRAKVLAFVDELLHLDRCSGCAVHCTPIALCVSPDSQAASNAAP